jgi:hypothetical protein
MDEIFTGSSINSIQETLYEKCSSPEYEIHCKGERRSYHYFEVALKQHISSFSLIKGTTDPAAWTASAGTRVKPILNPGNRSFQTQGRQAHVHKLGHNITNLHTFTVICYFEVVLQYEGMTRQYELAIRNAPAAFSFSKNNNKLINPFTLLRRSLARRPR